MMRFKNSRKVIVPAPILMGLVMLATLATAAVRTRGESAKDLKDWPAGREPEKLGKRLAEHFVPVPHQYVAPTLHYAEVLTWYGALRFAERTQDEALQQLLIARFRPLLPGGAEAALVPQRRHVDDSVFGILPMEIGYLSHNAALMQMGLRLADRQWEGDRPDGLAAETRFWVDDMFMVTSLQLEAYRVTKDLKYLDRAAKQMAAYLDRLQQPSGLFFHAQDVPIVWSRGNGWAAAGMVELLLAMPEQHTLRPRILKGYREMMAALAETQGSDGMWRQVIDHPESWPESSGSTMFTYAMVLGVEHGWLETQIYGRAARKAYLAVTGYIDQRDEVTNVCEGTNKRNDLEYYLMRRRLTGDFHGQAPMLWLMAALLF